MLKTTKVNVCLEYNLYEHLLAYILSMIGISFLKEVDFSKSPIKDLQIKHLLLKVKANILVLTAILFKLTKA